MVVGWPEIRHQAAIAGTITDGLTGKPLSGISVRITDGPAEFLSLLALKAAAYGPRWWSLSKALDRTVTAIDGHFHFLDLPDGPYTLQAAVPGQGSRYAPVQVAAAVSRNPDNSINLAVVNLSVLPTSVGGTVTNQAGDPVPMASVRVEGSGEQVFTDSNGAYTLKAIETGNRRVTASVQGHQPSTHQIAVNTAGSAHNLDFVLTMVINSPLSISGCSLWLRADNISGLSDGDAVSNWPDGSGRANHATQNSAGDQPSWRSSILAGHAVVRFDGTNDYLELPLAETSTDHTFVFVYVHTPSGASGNHLFDAQSGRLRLDAAGPGTPSPVRWNDGSWHDIGNAIAGAQVLAWVFSGNTGEVFRNGSRLGSNAYNPTPIGGRVAIGATNNGSSSFFAGDLAEVVYYNRALTPLERQQLEQYLSNRYSIPLA